MKVGKKKGNEEAKSFWFYIERASILLVLWFILHSCPIDPILEYVPAYVIHFLFSIPWMFIVWYGLKACRLLYVKYQKTKLDTKTTYCFPNSDNIINSDKIINIDEPYNTNCGIIARYGAYYKSKDDSVINGQEDCYRLIEEELHKIMVLENRYYR